MGCDYTMRKEERKKGQEAERNEGVREDKITLRQKPQRKLLKRDGVGSYCVGVFSVLSVGTFSPE